MRSPRDHGFWDPTILGAILVLSGCSSGSETRGDGNYRVAFDATNTGWLLSTWGTNGSNRYAVGGEPDMGAVWHHGGTTWQPEQLPESVPLLNWVFGFGPNDVTVVGNSGTILHFDGTSWSRVAAPTNEDLWGVWGARPDRLWAVGGAGQSGSEATLLAFDGQDWRKQDYDPLERANVHAFYKVWGSAENDVYVVGQNGAALHFDGARWTELLVGSSVDLITVFGTGADNVVAVGGRSAATVARFDGTSWNTRSYPEVPGINGIWMDNPRVAHLALTTGKLATLDVTTLELSVEQWDTTFDFHALFGTEDGVLTVVGGDFVAYPYGPFHGIALERELSSEE